MGTSADAAWGDAGIVDVQLPTDKLISFQPDGSNADIAPVVLVNCGSFNPPTIMHLRMLDLGAQVMRQAGHSVCGSYMSPVNDAYRKPELLPSEHRIAMCQLAAAESDLIMVDTWEAAQPQAQRSLMVLQRVQEAVQQNDKQMGVCDQNVKVRAMLVTGADVLESFTKPGVWLEDQVREILGSHGVVCISRNSTGLQQLLSEEGCILSEYKHNIHVIEDPATSGISSTILRQQIRYGNTIKYLSPDSVISYVKHHKLYLDKQT